MNSIIPNSPASCIETDFPRPHIRVSLQDIELEEQILGKVLLDPAQLSKLTHIPLAAFTVSANRIVWDAMLSCLREDKIPDLLTVALFLRKSGKLDQIGGQIYLAQLFTTQVHSGHLQQYAQELIEQYHRRLVAQSLENLLDAGRFDGEAIAQIKEQVAALERVLNKVTDPDEQLRLELLAYIKEPDPLRKLRLRGEICSRYRISAKDVDAQAAILERLHSQPVATRFSFNEFMARETQALNWIIPGILPAGETLLLAASAKSGKTALATDILYAVLTGSTVLGEKATPGRVLLISSDESENSTRRRFWARGVDQEAASENLRVMTTLDITNLADLESELQDFRPTLVIADSLTTICSEVGISEKDSEFARYIYKFKELLGRYGAAGILIHHENKDPLAKGIAKVSGNARITAAVWGIFQLGAVDPNNEQDQRRTLRLKPREGSPVIYNLEMNPKDLWASRGIFEFLGEFGDEAGQKRTLTQRVVDLLTKYEGKGLTFKEIDSQLNVGRSLYTILDRLEDRQVITRRRSYTDNKVWVYAVPVPVITLQESISGEVGEGGGDITSSFPPAVDSPPDSVSQTTGVELTESVDVEGFESIQQSFNTNSTDVQQTNVLTEGVESVESLYSNSCESNSTLSTNPGGGGGVEEEDESLNAHSVDDPVIVAGNVELVKSAIAKRCCQRQIALDSPEIINELSARWSQEFKAMVISLLSDMERDFCRRNLVFDGI